MRSLKDVLTDLSLVSNEINLTLIDNDDQDSSKFGYIGYQTCRIDVLIKEGEAILDNISSKESGSQ